MKSNNVISWTNYKFYIFILLFIGFSCNENEFLDEVPIDFYSPENSFINLANFEAAVYNLHSVYRDYFWGNDSRFLYWEPSDLSTNFYVLRGSRNFNQNLGPSSNDVLKLWETCYQIIYDANVILGRSEEENVTLTANEKLAIQAEASFFRGITYKILANMFGGVPIVLEETKAPKRDYVRATRQQVYEQSAMDLEFATENLKEIDQVDDSRINKLAANHYLSEVYVSLERWADAINEASKVINHPATSLMTERFGTRINDPDFGGDVYWDLFRQGNQNRSSGNTESVWVIQYAYNVPGDGGNQGYILERIIAPDLTRANILQSDGKYASVLKYPNSYVAGRGQGFMAPSQYFLYDLWEESGFDQDIRNSEHNIIRDVQVRNPDNEYDGKWVIADNLPLRKVDHSDTARFFYPIIGKAVTPGKHPAQFWLEDQTIPGSMNAGARTWRDHYELRLAETYLLRAEAYLGNGETAKAAEDINVVRRRAQAPEISPAQVDIDYILDERLRELYFEKLRTITLFRLGKGVDRVRRLNPAVAETMGDHQNLLGIPNSEILKNTEAVLEQNPGY